MSVILLPLPDGLPGEEAERLGWIIGAINGYEGQGVRFNLTQYDHATFYALGVRNLGTLGHHFAAWASDASVPTDRPIVAITDDGLDVHDDYAFSAGAASFSGDLEVLGTADFFGTVTTAPGVDVLVGGTLFADEGIDVLGGSIISGIALFHGQIQSDLAPGTAPLAVLSDTLVNNLNADKVDGQHLADLDTRYVNASGDTMSGGLTISTGGLLISATGLDVTGSITMRNQVASTVTAPTAPFMVQSGIVVTNLNADMVDGQHASAFASSSHNHDTAYVNATGDTMTGTLTISTGGLAITSGGLSVTDVITSTLAPGTAPFSVLSNTVVNNLNADKVDGQDASAFATSGHTHSYLPLTGGTLSGALTLSSGNLTLSTGGIQTVVGGASFAGTVTASADPPFSVSGTTVVNNLNAERVGGQTLANLDSRYVNATGDTMSGGLTISSGGMNVTGDITANNDVVVGGNLKLVGGSGAGLSSPSNGHVLVYIDGVQRKIPYWV